jgi:membrane protein
MDGTVTAEPAMHRRKDASPWSLPRAAWKNVAKRVAKATRTDHLSLVSAGVAFFGFLAVFPALGAVVALYGLIFDASQVHDQLAQIETVLPAEAVGLIEGQLSGLTLAAPESLSLSVVVAVLTAVWSANKGSRGLIEATNLAYEIEESRGFVRLTALSLAMTAGALVTVLVLLALVALLPAVLSAIGLHASSWGWTTLVRWPVITLVVMLGLAVVYTVAPNRRPPRWKWVSPGSIAATALLLVASGLFSLYVSNFGSYDRVYGSLGAVAVLLLWGYVAAFVVLLGAEINAEAEAECEMRTN